MRKVMMSAGLCVAALALAASPVWSKTKAEKQEAVQKSSREVLAELYKLVPEARKTVEGAAGYAVFSNRGVKIGIAGTGSGSGIAVDNATKAITYMKMKEVQAGLGLGVKKFKVVWVFETPAALKKFVDSGWEFGGQSSAAAKAGGKGGALAGAVSVSPGVWLYQIVEGGLALEFTAKGTKYYKDKSLN